MYNVYGLQNNTKVTNKSIKEVNNIRVQWPTVIDSINTAQLDYAIIRRMILCGVII